MVVGWSDMGWNVVHIPSHATPINKPLLDVIRRCKGITSFWEAFGLGRMASCLLVCSVCWDHCSLLCKLKW